MFNRVKSNIEYFHWDFPALHSAHTNQSTNIDMSSEFEAFWKPFARAFQSICISHYSVFRPHLHNNCLKSLPFQLHFIFFVTVHLTIVFLNTEKGQRSESKNCKTTKFKESPLMYYVNAINMVVSIATHIIIHLENVFYGKRENEIYQKMQMIGGIFANNLNYRINYRAWQTRYVRVVGIFVFAFLLSSATSFSKLPDSYSDKFFMNSIMIFGIIMNRARWCQIALFLNMLADTLNHLQIALKQHQIRNRKFSKERRRIDSFFECKKICDFRDIYSSSWYMITLMSDYFGWSAIAFLIKVTLEPINGAYWFYVNWHTFQSKQLYFRMNSNFYNNFIKIILFKKLTLNLFFCIDVLKMFSIDCILVSLYVFGEVSKNGMLGLKMIHLLKRKYISICLASSCALG